jgi:uncharacterized protein YdeI (YjbR/CyaY-like superfamily)
LLHKGLKIKKMEKKQVLKGLETEDFYASSRAAWRAWLQENHEEKQAVWLIYYKKKANQPSLSWSDAVDEALCFGWIDSTAKPIDEDTYKQFFTKRKPKSVWSKVNKEKIKRLTAEGLMTAAGLACIETAKQNGSWTILDEVEELIIPNDLEKAFEHHAGSKEFFLSLSKSAKKAMLHRIVIAKQQDTRQRRINEILEQVTLGLKPIQF